MARTKQTSKRVSTGMPRATFKKIKKKKAPSDPGPATTVTAPMWKTRCDSNVRLVLARPEAATSSSWVSTAATRGSVRCPCAAAVSWEVSLERVGATSAVLVVSTVQGEEEASAVSSGQAASGSASTSSGRRQASTSSSAAAVVKRRLHLPATVYGAITHWTVKEWSVCDDCVNECGNPDCPNAGSSPDYDLKLYNTVEDSHVGSRFEVCMFEFEQGGGECRKELTLQAEPDPGRHKPRSKATVELTLSHYNGPLTAPGQRDTSILFDGLQELSAAGQLSDVTFVVGPEEKHAEEVAAHTLLLSALSPVFRAMFATDPARRVRVSDARPDVFQEMIRCAVGECPPDDGLGSERLLELLYLAEKYALCSVKRRTESALLSALSLRNAFRVLEAAWRLNASGLVRLAGAGFVRDNRSLVLRGRAWRRLRHRQPALALRILEAVLQLPAEEDGVAEGDEGDVGDDEEEEEEDEEEVQVE